MNPSMIYSSLLSPTHIIVAPGSVEDILPIYYIHWNQSKERYWQLVSVQSTRIGVQWICLRVSVRIILFSWITSVYPLTFLHWREINIIIRRIPFTSSRTNRILLQKCLLRVTLPAGYSNWISIRVEVLWICEYVSKFNTKLSNALLLRCTFKGQCL